MKCKVKYYPVCVPRIKRVQLGRRTRLKVVRATKFVPVKVYRHR